MFKNETLYLDHIREMMAEDQHSLVVNRVARLKRTICRDHANDDLVNSHGGESAFTRIAGGPYALEQAQGTILGWKQHFRQMSLLETVIAEFSSEDLFGFLHYHCGRIYVDGYRTRSSQSEARSHLADQVKKYNLRHHGHYQLTTPVTEGSALQFMK